jgi:hypothetical protein
MAVIGMFLQLEVEPSATLADGIGFLLNETNKMFGENMDDVQGKSWSIDNKKTNIHTCSGGF